MNLLQLKISILLISWIASAYPQDQEVTKPCVKKQHLQQLRQQQEQQTEVPTASEAQTMPFDDDVDYNGAENGEYVENDELALNDVMDRYSAQIPFITGELNCQCGMPVSKIADGENADINQYPWTALLYAVESDTLRIPYCGGALINNLYVLTASHCVDGLNPKMVEVVLREQNLSTITPDDYDMPMPIGRASLRAMRIEIEKFIQHPKYSRTTVDNDIAVRLPLIHEFALAPICVPKKEALIPQGIYATVAGYGAKSEAGKPSANLQMAEVRVLSNELCNSKQFHDNKISESMLCADGGGKGPCAGDTGGPLMVRTPTGRQNLIGLASWSTTCEDSTRPAVYTRVSKYESWIRENTMDASWCEN